MYQYPKLNDSLLCTSVSYVTLSPARLIRLCERWYAVGSLHVPECRLQRWGIEGYRCRYDHAWYNAILTRLSLRGSLSVKSTEALTTQDFPAQRSTQTGVVALSVTGTSTPSQYVRTFRTTLSCEKNMLAAVVKKVRYNTVLYYIRVLYANNVKISINSFRFRRFPCCICSIVYDVLAYGRYWVKRDNSPVWHVWSAAFLLRVWLTVRKFQNATEN